MKHFEFHANKKRRLRAPLKKGKVVPIMRFDALLRAQSPNDIAHRAVPRWCAQREIEPRRLRPGVYFVSIEVNALLLGRTRAGHVNRIITPG